MGTSEKKVRKTERHADLSGEIPGTRADALIHEGGDLVVQVGLRGLLVKIASNGWAVRLTCASITVAAFVTGFGLLAAYLGAPVWGSLPACGVGLATAGVLIRYVDRVSHTRPGTACTTQNRRGGSPPSAQRTRNRGGRPGRGRR